MPKATPNATKRGAYRNLCIFLHIYLSKIQNISPRPVPNFVPGYRSLQTTCTSRSNTGISDTLSNSYLVTSSSEGSSVTTQSSSRSLRVIAFSPSLSLSLSLSLFDFLPGESSWRDRIVDWSGDELGVRLTVFLCF